MDSPIARNIHMKLLVKAFVFLVLLSAAPALPAQGKNISASILTKVDHFYVFADSERAEKLFKLFRDDFHLPQVWAFRNWGGYSSGGVWLGNVVLEFATMKDEKNPTPKTEFQGIVFEPVGDADSTVALLKARGIPHEDPIAENPGWTVIPFKDIPPENIFLMVCDYKDRSSVNAGRIKAARALKEADGGDLGVIDLKEIVVGVNDVRAAAEKWEKALGRKMKTSSGLFQFETGPDIRLLKSFREGIREIRLHTRSLKTAKRFLSDRTMLGEDLSAQLMIDPSTIDGLNVVLVK